MAEHADVAPEIVARLRAMCAGLPETVEETAWAGTRWVIRKKNFAHVVMIDDGWPPGYARAAGTDGPTAVLTFRATGAELAALTHAGGPFFKPPWFADIVGLRLGPKTDWTEVAELVTESYCLLAPRRLVDRLLGGQGGG